MKKLLNYFHSASLELHNVTWPTRRKAVIISIATIAFVLASAAVLGGYDYLMTLGITKFVDLNPFN